MSNLFPTQITPVVTIINGVPKTTSVDVANLFNKEHRNVLRDIQALDCSKEFSMLNFEHTPYVHPQNKQTYPMITMTKDGFTFLAMGYTGKEAAKFKEAYIKRFNEMEATLKKGVENQVDSHAYIEVLEKYVALLEEKTAVKPKLKRSKKIVTNEAKIKFKTLRDAGFNYREIAEQTGYSDSTVSLILKGMLQ